MSFLKRQQSNENRIALSLQKHLRFRTYTHNFNTVFPKTVLHFPQNNSNSFSKRISIGTSFISSNRGSLTVEAALVVPIFLFAIISIMSFSEILRVHMSINSSLQQTAKEMAMYGYAQKQVLGNSSDQLSLPIGFAFSESYVKSRVRKDLTDSYLSASPVEGAGNLSFIGSKIMKDDLIELKCTYHVSPFFALSEKAGFPVQSTAVARAFTGYDNCKFAGNHQDDQYVYITEYGEVYHKSCDCSYLDLSIHSAAKEDVSSLRNDSGGKYYACPLCTKGRTGQITYITNYGENYHYDVLCSGLKRTIKTVLLSQVGSKRPCSKCY